MEELSVWAPPNMSTESLCLKVNEWMEINTTKPPYKRFIQEYVSSLWPVLWHLKIEYKIHVNVFERYVIPSNSESSENVVSTELCAICHENVGPYGVSLTCQHTYHTGCIHQWLRRSLTCPLCRAPVCL